MSGAALGVIVFLIIGVAAAIVFLGSLPAKIARGRNHPHVDAVNAASWIGLATGIFWPVAFIWAFCPCPAPSGATVAVSGSDDRASDEIQKLHERLASLEATIAAMESAGKERN